MKSSDVHIGHTYSAKVSGAIVPVRITGTSTHGGWVAQNTKTGRAVRIKSPQRLRAEVPGATGPPSGRAAPPSALSQFRELKSRDPEVILFFAADTAFRPNYHVFNDDIQSLDAISPLLPSATKGLSMSLRGWLRLGGEQRCANGSRPMRLAAPGHPRARRSSGS
jgi:hypothetical protein